MSNTDTNLFLALRMAGEIVFDDPTCASIAWEAESLRWGHDTVELVAQGGDVAVELRDQHISLNDLGDATVFDLDGNKLSLSLQITNRRPLTQADIEEAHA